MNANSFLGTGWSFPPRFSRDGVEMVSDDDDVRESLAVLLSTAPGERTMRPGYGCGIRQHVFADMDDGGKAMLADVVRRAILFHESRVTVDSVVVDLDPEDRGLAHVRIDYVVDATNNRRNLVFPFYLAEGTDAQR